MEKGIKPIHLKGDLLHYSYYTIEEHIKQINYFTDIAATAYDLKGAKPSLFKVFMSSKFMFFKTYFLKLGILDGYYGWIISKNSAHATFLKYSKIRELQKEKLDVTIFFLDTEKLKSPNSGLGQFCALTLAKQLNNCGSNDQLASM